MNKLIKESDTMMYTQVLGVQLGRYIPLKR